MTLPKKDTRQIVVQAEKYLWHRNNDFDAHSSWTIIQKRGTDGQLLMLDPYHYDLSFGAGAVAMAIQFALDHGWTPQIKATPMKLRYKGDNSPGEAFTILSPTTEISDR